MDQKMGRLVLCLALLQVAIGLAEAQGGQIYYQVPDFHSGNQFATGSGAGYYAISSVQSTKTSHAQQVVITKVEEYFSLAKGLSYSLYENQDDPSERFAIIADGPRGKSYLVRNPDVVGTDESSGEQLDCELDHVHHHRQVFPWQYVYDNKSGINNSSETVDQDSADSKASKSKRNKRRNDKWARKRFIYGVGAIWLNAIERKIVSNEIDDDSPFADYNLWLMHDNDLKVKLLFRKPKLAKEASRIQFEEAIRMSELSTIEIRQFDQIEHNQDANLGGISSFGQREDIISVKKFEFISSKEALLNEILRRFDWQLVGCRSNTKKHRVFPSLMRELNLSPNKMFALEYVEKKFSLMKQPKSGSFDERRHRYVYDDEFHGEWFSFKLEAQLELVEGLVGDNYHGVEVEQADNYLKLFTKNYRGRSTRHSTVYYHFVDKSGETDTCKLGEHEPPPSDHLLIRPVHFHRPDSVQLTGHLTGLSALILNAADFHYKHFSLFKKTIRIPYEPTERRSLMRSVRVHEWQLYDNSLHRYLYFYFRADENDKSKEPQIGDLVRVDIRDSLVSNANESSDEKSDDFNMIVRYDVLNLNTDLELSEIERAFEVPKICENAESVVRPDDDHDEDSLSGDGADEFYHDPDYYHTNAGSDDDDDGADSSPSDQAKYDEQAQEEGAEFEFEPGMVQVDHRFPDFFEFLDGEPIYRFVSRISVHPAHEQEDDRAETEPRKHFYLAEQFNTNTEMAVYSLYYQTNWGATGRPDLQFFVNYNSELIFRVENHNCSLVDDVEPWMRLISSEVTYYRDPVSGRTRESEERKVNEVIIESNKLRLFGVGALWRQASESEYADYEGFSGRARTEADGSKTRLIKWSLMDAGDMDFISYFRFRLNVTRAQLSAHQSQTDLLTLEEIYLTNMDSIEYGQNVFQSVRIEPLSMSLMGADQLYGLPQICDEALKKEAQIEKDLGTEYLSSGMPSFSDFVGPEGSYYAYYTILHTVSNPESGTGKQEEFSLTAASEHFDSLKKRGIFTINSGPEVREMFINCEQKNIFLYLASADLCKRINKLQPLVDIGSLFARENAEFSTAKMFGIGALWIQLESIKGYNLRLSYRYDNHGNKFQVLKFRRTSDWSGSASLPNPTTIEVTFAEQMSISRAAPELAPGTVSKREKRQFVLERIEFTPQSTKRLSRRHRTVIEVSSIGRKPSVEQSWNLPDKCLELAKQEADGSSSASGERGQVRPPGQSAMFPKLMDLVRVSQQFYMRSEITDAMSLKSEEKRIYLMDEWLFNKNIRMKTYGRVDKLDLIIYGETKECFDVSVPWRCSQEIPNPFPTSARNNTSKLLEFWNDSETLIDKLSQLYYGPVALWYLAEKNIDNVQLANSFEIAPKNKRFELRAGPEEALAKLEHEMRTETWQVLKTAQSKNSWNYEMHFNKMIETKGNSTREWHVLQRIDLVDVEYLGLTRRVEIEVINYRYEHSEEEMSERFLLPEGYGCLRSEFVRAELDKSLNEFRSPAASSLPQRYWYEASLEMVDRLEEDSELSSSQLIRRVLPTTTGLVFQSARPFNSFNIFTDFSRTRLANGSMSAFKVVYDRQASILFRIDRMSGFCKVALWPNYNWHLDFPLDSTGGNSSKLASVILDDLSMDMLFMRTKERNSNPVNSYTSSNGRIVVSSYEETVSNLRLSSSLEGRAVIVRKFESDFWNPPDYLLVHDGNSQRVTKIHDSITTKVILFDSTANSDKKPKAILQIKLSVANISTSELLTATNVEQCYNDGDPIWDRNVADFLFEYPIETFDSFTWAQEQTQEMADEFVKLLLMRSDLLVTQLVGPPRIEFRLHEKLMRVHLRLLDPPSAIEYFTFTPQATMSHKLETMADVKLAASVNDCSKWCDQINCLAMTYCADHTCRAIAASASSRHWNNSDLSLVRHEEDCDYYYKVKSRPKTLENLALIWNLDINEQTDRKELIRWALILGGTLTMPSKFKQIKSDSSWLNEEFDADLSGSQSAPNSIPMDEMHQQSLDLNQVFTLLKQNHKIDMEKLTSFTGEQNVLSFVEHAQRYPQCLEACRRSPDCLLVGFCKGPGTCVTISGKADMRRLQSILVPEEDEKAQCSISVRNLLNGFVRFEDTQMPREFERRLDGYSAIECASVCTAQDGGESTTSSFNCLSFDYCIPKGSNGTQKSVEQSICYLEHDHVMLSSFDRSILMPRWLHSDGSRSTENNSLPIGQKFTCQHYSKSMIADFHKIASKKFEKRPTSLVRGFSSERCAAECQVDENCRAFEYCINEKRQPSQACYFLRSNETNSGESSKTDRWSRANIEAELVKSKRCSVFTFKHFAERLKWDEQTHTVSLMYNLIDTEKLMAKHGGAISWLGFTFLYMMIAVLVASLIQFGYIRLFGWPINV